jgi:hypothetical protein
MADRARRKEKQRLKRQQKQRDRRRAASASPFQRLAATAADSGTMRCFINAEFAAHGMASIYVLRDAPGGGHAMAAFLVDLWCCGLKEVWGHLDIPRREFEDLIKRANDRMPQQPCNIDLVRRLVAGGIRFARQNGFRLPPRYERWLALIGGVGDPATADLQGFGKDGKLRYIGPIDDLARRLIHCSADDFLDRPDVEWIMPVGGFGDMLDEDEDEDTDVRQVDEMEADFQKYEQRREADVAVEDAARMLSERVTDAAREWCFSKGLVPHPRLAEGFEMLLEAMLQAPADSPAERTLENVGRLAEFEDEQERAQLLEAIEQVRQFMKDLPTPQHLTDLLGLGPEADEESAKE